MSNWCYWSTTTFITANLLQRNKHSKHHTRVLAQRFFIDVTEQTSKGFCFVSIKTRKTFTNDKRHHAIYTMAALFWAWSLLNRWTTTPAWIHHLHQRQLRGNSSPSVPQTSQNHLSYHLNSKGVCFQLGVLSISNHSGNPIRHINMAETRHFGGNNSLMMP